MLIAVAATVEIDISGINGVGYSLLCLGHISIPIPARNLHPNLPEIQPGIVVNH